jgi:hypothetical protein
MAPIEIRATHSAVDLYSEIEITNEPGKTSAMARLNQEGAAEESQKEDDEGRPRYP